MNLARHGCCHFVTSSVRQIKDRLRILKHRDIVEVRELITGPIYHYIKNKRRRRYSFQFSDLCEMMTDWKRRLNNARPDEYRMSKNGKKKNKKIVVLKNKYPNILDEKCKSDFFSIKYERRLHRRQKSQSRGTGKPNIYCPLTKLDR